MNAGTGWCKGFACDITKTVEALVEFVRREFQGKLDVLINNSGTNYAMPLEEYPA